MQTHQAKNIQGSRGAFEIVEQTRPPTDEDLNGGMRTKAVVSLSSPEALQKVILIH